MDEHAGNPRKTLARAWPGSRLVVVEDAGHLGSDAMSAEIRTALDEFAAA